MLIYLILGSLLSIGIIISLFSPDKELIHFGKQETQPLRALLAIGIILTHTGYPPFWGWGWAIVSEFFFLSAYGLIISYRKKGEGYLQGFLRNRMLSVLAPFIIALLFWQLYLLMWGPGGGYYTSHLAQFRLGDPCIILPSSWFIFAIILVYLMFYWIAKIFKDAGIIVWMFSVSVVLAIVLFLFLNIKYNFGSQWFISSAGLIEGSLVAYYENRIREWIKSHKVLSLSLSLFSLVAIYIIGLHTQYGYVLLNALFPLIVLLLIYVLGSVNIKMLNYLGLISLEIYLMQGIVTAILRWDYGDSLGAVSYTILSIVFSIMLASILSIIKKPILSWFKNSNSKN